MVAREGFHPLLVVDGPLRQGWLRDRVDPVQVTKEIDDVLGTRQQRQVPLDDDPVETVVYQSQQAAKQLVERFHRSPPVAGRIPRSSDRGPMEIQGGLAERSGLAL